MTRALLAIVFVLALAATAAAQEEPACRAAVLDALDALDEIDREARPRVERVLEQQRALTSWLVRANEVDELALLDRVDGLDHVGYQVRRGGDVITEAEQRDPWETVAAVAPWATPLLGLLGLGGFRAGTGRWPFQPAESAAASAAAKARRLARAAEGSSRERQAARQALDQIVATNGSAK